MYSTLGDWGGGGGEQPEFDGREVAGRLVVFINSARPSIAAFPGAFANLFGSVRRKNEGSSFGDFVK